MLSGGSPWPVVAQTNITRGSLIRFASIKRHRYKVSDCHDLILPTLGSLLHQGDSTRGLGAHSQRPAGLPFSLRPHSSAKPPFPLNPPGAKGCARLTATPSGGKVSAQTPEPHHRVGVQSLHVATQPPAQGLTAQPLRHILGRACLASEQHQELRAWHRCAARSRASDARQLPVSCLLPPSAVDRK
jgi:hypothetical protein